MVALLPGLALPRWLLFISVLAFGNTVSSYLTPIKHSSRVYAREITPLSARLFGCWTVTSSLIRSFCAYDVHNPSLYTLTFLTFAIALGHFSSELFLFKTGKPGFGAIGPLFISSFTMLWMWSSWNYYVPMM